MGDLLLTSENKAAALHFFLHPAVKLMMYLHNDYPVTCLYVMWLELHIGVDFCVKEHFEFFLFKNF